LVQLLLDELPGAVAGAERVVTTLRSVGAADLLPAPLLILARCEIRRGEFMRARAAAYEAASLIASIGGATSELGGVFEPDCMAVLCLIEAVTGDADQCRRHAKSCLVAGAGRRPDFMTGHGLRALGLLALGSGDALRAIEQLQHLDTLAEDFGIRETPTLSWLADLAEAYLLAGQRENATTTIGRMASHAATVETPTAKALLLRLNALAASDADRLIEAAQQLQQSGMPFESARALLSAGRLLRRRKHIGTARQHLQSARNTFEAIGAGLWREHTEAELRACGVAIATTASPLAALTPQELQVAQLAATGDSNAQIAATLFLSRKTIEFHLSNVFRKIGVTRRAQLASAVPGLLAAVS
jgi:DNA-binding CsgD family transcriptional regulator